MEPIDKNRTSMDVGSFSLREDRLRVLTINSSYPEVEHLAAGLASIGILSKHVRPYANKDRIGEQILSKLPGIGSVYRKTIGRRTLVNGLPNNKVIRRALLIDFTMALAIRMRARSVAMQEFHNLLTQRRVCILAKSGAKQLSGEHAVIASWGCAEPAFNMIKKHGGLCILDYPIAHHNFMRRYLLEEAKREPDFASTLNGHDFPNWYVHQLNAEVELADKILVGSSFVRETFMLEGVREDKIEIIPYGVDAELFKPCCGLKEKHTFNVLFIGQLSQRKGLSYLLKAYEQISDRNTSLTLVGQIQGDGKALLRWRHLFNHIPHVTHAELAAIIRKADVFVFPTLVEGMPLVVLEAMASGLPVVTTPNGPCDIVRDGVDGFLVPARDIYTLVDRLKRLRADPDLRLAMGKASRHRALQFTWSQYRDQVKERITEWLREPVKII